MDTSEHIAPLSVIALYWVSYLCWTWTNSLQDNNFNLFCLLVNLLTDLCVSFDGVCTIVERDATLIALMKILLNPREINNDCLDPSSDS